MKRDIIDVTRIYGRDVLARVAQKHGLTRQDIVGRSRLRAVTIARQEAMWAMRAHTDLSYPQIGRILDRDHTTVMHGVMAHEARQR